MFFFKGSLFLYFLFLWFWCLLRKQNCESSPSKQSFEINSARALESVATECRDKGTYSHKHLCSIPTPCNHTSQTTKWKTGVFQADTIHSLGRDLKDLTLCGPRDSADGKPTASCLRLKPTDLVSFNIHIPTPDRRWLVSLPSGWERWRVGWLRLFVRCRSEESFISICSILFLFFSRGIIHWVISLLALLASVLFFLPSFLSSSLPPFLPSFHPFPPSYLPSFLLPLSPSLSLSVLQVCLLCWLLFFLGLFVYNLQSWLMTYFFVRVEIFTLWHGMWIHPTFAPNFPEFLLDFHLPARCGFESQRIAIEDPRGINPPFGRKYSHVTWLQTNGKAINGQGWCQQIWNANLLCCYAACQCRSYWGLQAGRCVPW